MRERWFFPYTIPSLLDGFHLQFLPLPVDSFKPEWIQRSCRKARSGAITAMIKKVVHAAKMGFLLIVQGFDADLFQTFL